MIQLGEVAEFEMGQAPPGAECNAEGRGTLFVKAGEFGALYPVRREWTTKPLKIGRLGDVFVCVVGATAGKLNLGVDCAIGRSVAAIRPQSKLDTRYLYYQLLPWVKRIRAASAGSAQGVITKKQLAELPILVPALDDQRVAVAEIEKQFSRLDEAVAGLQRVKANLKRYKAAVLKSAVTGRLVPTEAELARREGRNYETGAELLQRILETRRSQWQGKGKYKEPAAPDTTDLPELPEGWTWATLPQLGELARGKSKHRPRDDARLYGGPYPFIQTGDVRRSDGSISEHTQSYSELGLAQSRLWPTGTLCITIAANIAETGILAFESCFPDSIVGFISALESVTTRYVEFFIRTSKENLERFAPATAQKNINLEVLEAVAVPLPPILEQHRIVAEVDRLLSIAREVEVEVETNLKRAQGLRQAILGRAFFT